LATPNPAPQPSDSAIKVIMCTIAFRDRLLDHALSVARSTGFDGVEIWGREPHVAEKFDENRVRAAKKLLEAEGITPYVLGSYLRFGATKPEGSVGLSDVLHTARWLRTPLVRVWASDVGSGAASPAIWEQTVTEAQEACDTAAKLGLKLVAEMHGQTLADTTDGALQLVERVARDNFRLNFQVSCHNDGQTPEERLAAVLPWVSHVHAQNYQSLAPNAADTARRAPLAAGIVNYRRLLGMLRDAGYTGCVAVEFAYDETGDKGQAMAHDAKFLKTICV
jgi:sugar phosphate isomerase/epimerase